MAPKGGGRGGSRGGSGGASCDYCSVPLLLSSAGYTEPDQLAILAFSFIIALVALVTLVIVLRKPWLKPDGQRNKLLRWSFVIAALSMFIWQVLNIVDSLLHIYGMTVTYGYLIVYIFGDMFERLAKIFLTLLVIYNVEEVWLKGQGLTRSYIRGVNLVLWLLLLALTIAGWSYVIRRVAAILDSGFINYTFDAGGKGVSIAYAVVTFLISIEMIALTIVSFTKITSRKLFVFLMILVAAFWLWSLMYVIYIGKILDTYDIDSGIYDGYTFVSDLCYIAMFVMLALLSWTTHKSSLDTLMHGTSQKTAPMDIYGNGGTVNGHNANVPVYNQDMAYHNSTTYNTSAPTAPLIDSAVKQTWQPQPDYQTQHPYYQATTSQAPYAPEGPVYQMPQQPQQTQTLSTQQRFYQGGGAYASVPQQPH